MPATIEYDSTGNVMAAVYKPSANEAEQTYYYTHNWRGDVVALYDSTGSLFARYDYDAWGKLLSIKDASGNDITYYDSFAIINPIRYRGYFYDTESGLYYLQSRYYDPVTGRFVNEDSYMSTGDGILGTNMFAYCCNNPVVRFDPCGNSPIDFLKNAWNTWKSGFDTIVNAPTLLGAQLYLRNIKKWKYSARFLEHATKKNSYNLVYYNNSDIAKDLKETSVIKNKIKSFKKSGKSYKKFNIVFKSGDFFGAFHKAELHCYKDKNGEITAKLHDTYDFDLSLDYYTYDNYGFLVTCANNYAFFSQCVGSLKKYDIDVYMIFRG